MAVLCPKLGCDMIADDLAMTGVGLSLGGQPFDDSGAASRVFEGSQFVFGEGPFVESVTHNSVIDVPDLMHAEVRWFSLAHLLIAGSIGAVFSFPLALGENCIGALTLYRVQPGALSAGERDGAVEAAQMAALTIAGHVLADHDEHETTCGFHRLDLFNRAVGVVMRDVGVGAEDATSRIRSHAYTSDCLCDDIVDDLLAGRLRLAAN